MKPEFRAALYLCAEMRGFDLGDDQRLLARDLAPLKRGVLLYRAGCWKEALAQLEQAEEPSAAFLACFCVARLETPQAALDRLPTTTDDDLDQATMAWGQGELLWAAGRLDQAETTLANAASVGATAALARLRFSRGQIHEAAEAYRLLGREEPYLGALIQLALGDLEEARRTIGWASVEQLAIARKDPRLKALKIPRPTPRKRRGSFEMLSKKDVELYTSQLRKRYSGPWPLGLKWTEELWEWCGKRVETARVIALGPSATKRNGGDLPPALVEDGDSLYLAPNLEIPPPLWPRVEESEVEEALAAFANVRRPRLSLPRRVRAFMGYREATFVPNPFTGEWQEAGPHELDRHWNLSPCLDSFPWGGGYPDDPWPESIPEQPDRQLKLSARLDEVRQQAEGGISTFTMRTTASRSQLTTEYHPGGSYVWEVRYHTNPWPQVIEEFNRRLGVDFPTDLPVDIVGALYGFEFAPLDRLWRLMQDETEPTALAGWFDVLAATGHNDVRTAYRLREYQSHPGLEVRAALANVAVRYNWTFVLRDMIAQEADDEFATWMVGHYENGPPAPQLNILGEPVV